MEEVHVPGEGPDFIYAADGVEAGDAAVADRVQGQAESAESEEAWRYVEHEPSLLNAGFTVELRNIKTVMSSLPIIRLRSAWRDSCWSTT